VDEMQGRALGDYHFEGYLPLKGQYLIEIQSDRESKSFKMIVQ